MTHKRVKDYRKEYRCSLAEQPSRSSSTPVRSALGRGWALKSGLINQWAEFLLVVESSELGSARPKDVLPLVKCEYATKKKKKNWNSNRKAGLCPNIFYP